MKKKVFIFSGQGCQYYNMGKTTWNKNNLFRENMRKTDHIIKEITGVSIQDEIYKDSNEKIFDDFKKAHLSIFAFQHCVTETLKQSGIYPDIVVGSSLGEYCAATESGIFDFEQMVYCLSQQADVVTAQLPLGGMMSVFSQSSLFDDKSIFLTSELVSINHMKNFTISGNAETINQVAENLKVHWIGIYPLPVRYGFHSSDVEPIRDDIIHLFEQMDRKRANCKIMSGLTGNYIEKMDSSHCWNIIRNPININKCFQMLEDKDCIYIDLSPTGEIKVALNYLYPQKEGIYSFFSRFSLKNIFDDTVGQIKSRKDTGMKAYVFPGQGSQEKGMGAKLFDEFADLTKSADSILGYSIKDLCLYDKDNKLQSTEYTQPAIYIVSVMDYLKSRKEGIAAPDYVAGHSIGEYAALYAAGVFDFETGLKLVKKRGELMAKANGGGMAAIIGLTKELVLEVLEKNDLNRIDVANYNGVKQIVISGLLDDIVDAGEVFLAVDGCRNYVKLNVSGAFHSRYMRNAMEEFAAYIRTFSFHDFQIPVISNKCASPYQQEDFVDTLTEQIVSPVQWTDSIRYLMGLGIEDITQKGPGQVTKNLVKKILKEAEPLYIVEDSKSKVCKNDSLLENGYLKKKKELTPYILGSKEFLKTYHVKYPYVVGGMYKGISGVNLVTTCAKAGILSFYGTGGQKYEQIVKDITALKQQLTHDEPYGVNLISNLRRPEREKQIIDLLLEQDIHYIEAAAYISITKDLVRYRLTGLHQDSNHHTIINNKIIAKVSRPEVAISFMSPPPERLIQQLLLNHEITPEEAQLGKYIPIADDVTVEADSAGHTDRGNAYCLIPAMLCLRDRMMEEHKYQQRIRIGAAGGIGTPQSAAAAFTLGAEYIVTGSINQCTVEADTSDLVKDMLNEVNVQDMEYAPAGDSFESGTKVQVLKKGTLFPMRGNKLFALYSSHNSLSEIDDETRKKLESSLFDKTFEEVYSEVKNYYDDNIIQSAEKNEKIKMALVFKCYFAYATQNALIGNESQKSNFQIQCGPALGAFNQYVRETDRYPWKNRHVDAIGIFLMEKTAKYLSEMMNAIEED